MPIKRYRQTYKCLVFVLIIGLILCACNKTTSLTAAQVIYSGPIALDGCGWLIETAQETYMPELLDSSFQIDSLQIFINYDLLGFRSACGLVPDAFETIEITHIEK